MISDWGTDEKVTQKDLARLQSEARLNVREGNAPLHCLYLRDIDVEHDFHALHGAILAPLAYIPRDF